MLIVEGPDGAGKTTLIRQLQERYGFEVAPRVVDKDTNAMGDLKSWVEQNLEAGFQDLIFDRHRLISEPIYAPIMGRPAAPGFDDVIWLNRQYQEFWAINPVVIYCIPPKKAVVDNVWDDPDNRSIRPYIDVIYNAYVARAAQDWVFGRNLVDIWDYTRDGAEADPLLHFDGMVEVLFNRTPKEKQ